MHCLRQNRREERGGRKALGVGMFALERGATCGGDALRSWVSVYEAHGPDGILCVLFIAQKL